MPNWCSNTLNITGNKKQIAEFREKTFIENHILSTEEEINQFHAEHIVKETPKKYWGDIQNYMSVQNLTPIDYITTIHKYRELQGKKEESTYLQNKQGYIKQGTHLDFNGTVPCPTELNAEELHTWGGPNATERDRRRATMQKKYGYNNAYDWHCAKWGTKWNACSPELFYESKNELNYTFDTAWSPPTAWLRETALMFPQLSFELSYREEGCDLMGTTKVKGDSLSD